MIAIRQALLACQSANPFYLRQSTVHRKSSQNLWIGGEETSREVRSDTVHRKKDSRRKASATQEKLISFSEMNGQVEGLHSSARQNALERQHREKTLPQEGFLKDPGSRSAGCLGPPTELLRTPSSPEPGTLTPVVWSLAAGTTSLEV